MEIATPNPGSLIVEEDEATLLLPLVFVLVEGTQP